MPRAPKVNDKIIRDVAESTGVDERSVSAVLEHLGLSRSLEALTAVAQPAKLRELKTEDVRIAVRLNKNTFAV